MIQLIMAPGTGDLLEQRGEGRGCQGPRSKPALLPPLRRKSDFAGRRSLGGLGCSPLASRRSGEKEGGEKQNGKCGMSCSQGSPSPLRLGCSVFELQVKKPE